MSFGWRRNSYQTNPEKDSSKGDESVSGERSVKSQANNLDGKVLAETRLKSTGLTVRLRQKLDGQKFVELAEVSKFFFLSGTANLRLDALCASNSPTKL